MPLIQNIESKLSIYQSVIAGGVAGAVTRGIAQPLDVLKIRFQLQIEPIKSGQVSSKYSSILQAVSSIAKEEGVTSLWSGHIPAQLLSISYGAVQFTVFEKLSQVCEISNPKIYNDNRHSFNFCNGAIAAALATIVSYPFDTVRTRLIAEQKTNKVYKGVRNAFQIIIKQEGPSALYKGLIPTIAQIAPHAGIQFAVYKLFTDNILNKIEFFQRGVSMSSVIESTLIGNLLAGSFAGLVSKTAIYPFDLIKKRLQIQGFQMHRTGFGKQIYCKGLIDCIRITVTEEGLLALYKGYGPSVLKAVLTSALHFAVYDEIKHLILSL